MNLFGLVNIWADLEEMRAECRISEEMAQHAMIDVARLADELRMEQDVASLLERERKVTEAQVKDAHTCCDKADRNTLKGGKQAVNKMESCICELESEMESDLRRFGNSQRS